MQKPKLLEMSAKSHAPSTSAGVRRKLTSIKSAALSFSTANASRVKWARPHIISVRGRQQQLTVAKLLRRLKPVTPATAHVTLLHLRANPLPT